MLLSLRLNNCFVFDKEVEFSMRANMHYRKFQSNVFKINNNNVLKSSIIFGPNNSGKTNFVHALKAVRDILLNKKNTLMPNLFSNNNICQFEIAFLSDGIEYIFTIKYDVVSKEYIYEKYSKVVYDKHKNKKIVDIIIRDSEHGIYFCDNHELIAAMRVSAKNNILMYLLDTKQFEILDSIKQKAITFASKIDVLDMNNIPINKTIEMLKSSSSSKQKIVNFILNADLSLEDYKYLGDDELEINLSHNSKYEGDFKPQEVALELSSSLIEKLHLCSVYKGIPVPSMIFDSTGTKKMASIASYVIDALENGKILVVDELDNSLHFRLTRAIISLFNNELNTRAQLIATVHDISLLDCQKLFRKEQIWFSHKDEDDAYLYSLSDFTSEKDKIRDTTDLLEKYKQGVFGALPEPDLFESLLEVSERGQNA